MLKFGKIPDEVFKEIGLTPDMNAHGKVVERNATISQESQQRCKCLMHDRQIMLRKELVERTQAVIQKKAAAEQEKKEMQSTNVQRIIDKLIDSVPNGIFEERTLEYCELSQFSKLLTSQELADFIYAHDPKVLQKKDVHPHPHKVKLQDAKDAVESGAVLGNNGIWQAFMCRNNPNKLKPPPATKSEAASVNETEEIPHIQVLELGRNEARVVPSQLLEDSQWRELTTRLFGVENLVGDICFNNEMKGRADLLAGKLRDRLKSFLRRRVAPRICR
jgi:hypothetical protein